MVQAYPKYWIGKMHLGNPITAIRKEARKVGGDALIDVQIHPIKDAVGDLEYRWTAFVIIWERPKQKPATESP
jgi:hypothetical protein